MDGKSINGIGPQSSGPRGIVERTRGRSHGPITRLVSPSDLGELIKPFVFLDYFSIDPARPANFGLHPHSGIATLTMLIEGSFDLRDSRGAPAYLEGGGMEWMRAGGGVWHGGPIAGDKPIRGYQLWVSLPPELELSESYERFLRPEEVPASGPARILLGHFEGQQNPLGAPASMTYLHVRLRDGERWRFEPPAGHDVLWIAAYAGSLDAGEPIAAGEMAVFEAGDRSVEFSAGGECGFILGSAARSPYDLVLGYYSVHTNAAALQQGEANIERLGMQLQAQGRR